MKKQTLAEYIDSNVSDAKVDALWHKLKDHEALSGASSRGGRRTLWLSAAGVAAGALLGLSMGLGWGSDIAFQDPTDASSHGAARVGDESRLQRSPESGPSVAPSATAMHGSLSAPRRVQFPSAATLTETKEAAASAAQPDGERAAETALRTSQESLAIDLKDGSSVQLSPHSQVSLRKVSLHDDTELTPTGLDPAGPADSKRARPGEASRTKVLLSLGQGRVDCKVTKDPLRTFTVMAGPVQVHVIGTVFSVKRSSLSDQERISVEVKQGRVKVRGPDGVSKKISAGESWSILVPLSEEKMDLKTASHSASLPSAHQANANRASTPTAQNDSSAKDTARLLFEQARSRRNGGQPAQAALLYQRFLSKHPDDARVGVAALELGRLKMDQLGDLNGALAPLSQAASRNSGGLGDDALARLTEAYSRLGRVSSCRQSKARYQKTYPNGVHQKQVARLCPSAK